MGTLFPELDLADRPRCHATSPLSLPLHRIEDRQLSSINVSFLSCFSLPIEPWSSTGVAPRGDTPCQGLGDVA